MKEKHTFYVPDAIERNLLPDDEARHAVRALRMTTGDEMWLLDGKGNLIDAMVEDATQKRCTYRIVNTEKQPKAWKGYVHLAIAPTKHIDRTEWLVEKATEIGVDEITFLRCRFSERTTLRLDRMENIVVAAMKQSRNAYKPKVNDLMSFRDFILRQANAISEHEAEQATFIAHCYNEQQREDMFRWLNTHTYIAHLTLMIGPEGDFSIDEVRDAISQGYESITLGNSRLRTETAGLMAVAMAQLSKRKG